MSIVKFIVVILFSSSALASPYGINELNQKLRVAMKLHKVPVVGYAVIQNYKIIISQTLSIDPAVSVSINSIFQAASISKSVSAYGVLKLVSKEKLALDKDINKQLAGWKIPLNKFNKNNPVTLRQVLSMTSGLSVAGFPGHVQGSQLPTLNNILEGHPPANTAPIRVFYRPGSRYFYSGGGYEVLEQLINDTTKQPFKRWMKKEILKPLHMEQSIFQNPLPKNWRSIAVPGFLNHGNRVKGGWNNYTEASAAGLWSTPTDLAQFAIAIAKAYFGKDNRLINKSLAQEMLKRQNNTNYGLGVVINGQGKTLSFRKAGHNLGYHSELILFPNTGDGAIIMTNSENGEAIINYMMNLLAQTFNWPVIFFKNNFFKE
ncbi:serine hydrolase domain-containing protein [Legionella fairfieldensis]|uniref:serine hydrolase domain-containing protein n=1 Tax=Legionella fairfieldensis TaxID=45064 RepID=UPI000686942F|nr:serine hydrolase domain-containing protein [Legionella fairfieldensis]